MDNGHRILPFNGGFLELSNCSTDDDPNNPGVYLELAADETVPGDEDYE